MVEVVIMGFTVGWMGLWVWGGCGTCMILIPIRNENLYFEVSEIRWAPGRTTLGVI